MGAVSPSSLLGGLVDLDVLDDQVAGVETLDIGVGGGVLEETEKVLGRLSGPSSAGDTELLACSKSRLVSILISIIETMRNRIAGRGNIDNSTTTKEKLKKSSWDFRTLGGSADAASVSSESNGLLVLLDVLEELDSAVQLPAVDGLGGLPGVLEGDSQVSTAGAG